MLFGKKKKKDLPGKKKKKEGKLLKAIGIEAERAPEEKEIERQQRHAKIIQAWEYVRVRIDRGAEEYLQTGSEEILRDHVARPALDALLEHLRRIKEDGLQWSQPDRQARTQPQFEVVSEKLNSRGQPTSFVIRESFLDNSIFQSAEGQKQASGNRRSIQATVEVENGQNFFLVSVLEVQGKSI
jgi:hypothetical protein